MCDGGVNDYKLGIQGRNNGLNLMSQMRKNRIPYYTLYITVIFRGPSKVGGLTGFILAKIRAKPVILNLLLCCSASSIWGLLHGWSLVRTL